MRILESLQSFFMESSIFWALVVHGVLLYVLIVYLQRNQEKIDREKKHDRPDKTTDTK
jgi:hypothetical protein